MMKKLANAGKVLTIASLIVLTGCKKDSKTAFPSQPNAGGSSSEYSFGTASLPTIVDADGILASIHAHNYKIITISPVEKENEYGMAAFASSTGNFSMLLDADSVRVNGANCLKASNFSYCSDLNTYSLGFGSGSTINWYVKGSTVPAMTNVVPAGDPTYSYFSVSTGTASTVNYWKDEWLPRDTIPLTKVTPKPTWSITPPSPNHTDSIRWENDSTSFKDQMSSYVTTLAKHIADSVYNISPYGYIPLKVTNSLGTTVYLSNTDTVIYSVHDDAGYSYTRKVASTDTTIALKPIDFANHANYTISRNLIMEINLVKYYPTVVSGKKYYYIKMGAYARYWRTN